ncbi:MAG: VacJ family lipoprotein [Rhodospirillales bacterium]|nr:VacJ family lipoprotein [Rhodospirillaceae bacterium]MBT7771936.1 VacJ family lipoprotein [Rhodospirillales bacterium]MBT8001799.1 VacJ family lipoprotein [Rhodospirillales bacterium]
MQRVKKFLPISVAFLFGLFVLVGPTGQALAADSDGFDSSTLAVASADVQLAGKHSMKKDADDANDPLESINRAIFSFNEFLLQNLIRPVAVVYRDSLPKPIQNVIGNFLHNLNSPTILANDLLQLEFGRAVTTAKRFAINSTVGLFGFTDPAAEMGYQKHKEDLGQTFAVWGVGEGFYMILPILGPSNPRDLVGRIGDGYMDPLNMWANNTDRDWIPWSRALVGGIHLYSGLVDELDEVKKTSVDYYATIRSLARQKRAAEIRNGKEADLPAIPDLGYDYDNLNDDLKQPAAAPVLPVKKSDQVS